jgi:membrane protease YdiL (CAAX protease family)
MSIYPEPASQGPYLTEPVPPSPPPFEPAPRRIPHLGHAVLFIVIAGAFVFGLLISVLLLSGGLSQHGQPPSLHPKLQMLSLGTGYILTFVAASLLFPRMWNRSFLEGIRWNWYTARVHAPKLITLGLLLGLMMQLVTYFITPPKKLPIDEFFATPLDAWLMTIFGVFIAPAFEEICFRGFLVPGFAIAYDFLTIPRTPEAQVQWQTTTILTPVSLMFSAVATSLLFAWMHAAQVSYLWPALLALFSVSVLLTMVRVRTQSVAASTIVHAAYNSFIFIAVLIQTGGYRHLDRLTR